MQILGDFGAVDYYFDMFLHYFQACTNDSRDEPQDSQPNQETRPYAFPSASLDILRNFRSIIGAVDGGGKRDEATLSVSQMIEVSVRYFIHSNTETGKNLTKGNSEYSTRVESHIMC